MKQGHFEERYSTDRKGLIAFFQAVENASLIRRQFARLG